MRVIYLIQFQKFHPSRAERVILFFRQALRHLKAIVGNQLGFLYNLVGPAMNPLDIDIDACMDAFMDACVARIGSDPEGWDKPSSEEEHQRFMKFSNHDLSVEDVDFGTHGAVTG